MQCRYMRGLKDFLVPLILRCVLFRLAQRWCPRTTTTTFTILPSLLAWDSRFFQDALTAIKSGRLPPPGDLPKFDEIKEVVGFSKYYAEDEYYSVVAKGVSSSAYGTGKQIILSKWTELQGTQVQANLGCSSTCISLPQQCCLCKTTSPPTA